jgi:hypothetical protein
MHEMSDCTAAQDYKAVLKGCFLHHNSLLLLENAPPRPTRGWRVDTVGTCHKEQRLFAGSSGDAEYHWDGRKVHLNTGLPHTQESGPASARLPQHCLLEAAHRHLRHSICPMPDGLNRFETLQGSTGVAC